jgi:hypothetical protein
MPLNKDKYIIYHGIKLAENSSIVNCEIESLSADPFPTRIGRVWYNTTDKVFKYSGLDQSNQIIIKSFDDFGGLTTFIQDLVSTDPGKGANIIGYEGNINTFLTIPPGTIKDSLDVITTELGILKNSLNNLVVVDQFVITQDGPNTVTLSKVANDKNKLMVLINGLEQGETDYQLTTNNNQSQISFDLIYNNDKVKVVNFEIL